MRWKQTTNQLLKPLVGDLILRGGRKVEKSVGMNYLYYKKVRTRGYIEENFHKKFSEYIRKRARKDKNYISNLFKQLYADCNEAINYSKWLSNQNLNNKSDKEVKKLFTKIIDKLLNLSASLYTPLGIETVTEDIIRKELKKRLKDKRKIEDYFLILTSPLKETRTGKAQKELLKIAVKINKIKNLRELFKKNIEEIKEELGIFYHNIYKEILEYNKRTEWINAKFIYCRPYKIEDVIKRLKTLIFNKPEEQLRKIQKQRINRERKTRNIIKELKLDKEFQKIIKQAKENVFHRTYRLEVYGLAGYYLISFFNKLASRLNTSYEGLFHLTINEIKNSSVNFNLIKKRRQDYAAVMENGKIQFVTGKDIEKFEEKKEFDKDIKEIKGEIGNKGKATGYVKLISGKHELSKIKEGEIMVAEFTTPDLVPAMEKAKALVTDIGGITSHSAIVSRELGIPSVIGTNIATQVLKDGDLVEVNADKGIVRKL